MSTHRAMIGIIRCITHNKLIVSSSFGYPYMSIHITQACIDDAHAVAALFDAYRVFYGQASDIPLAHAFIDARLQQQDSVIFLATREGEAVGFTQLYPSFSSVSAQRTWILNDLYVAEDARRLGIAKQLMDAAKQHAIQTHAKGISLATAVDNQPAKMLYDALGYTQNTAFDYYFLTL